MENKKHSESVGAIPVEEVGEKELLAWRAPSRPFRKRTREFYSTIGVIVLLVFIILFFAKEFLLIGVVFSLAFIGYALGSVPPMEVDYKLTNKGLYVGEIFYPFANLGRFWFEEKWKQEMVLIEHTNGFPGVVLGVLDHNRVMLEKLLVEYKTMQKPDQTPIDKVAKWLTDKVPLETD